VRGGLFGFNHFLNQILRMLNDQPVGFPDQPMCVLPHHVNGELQ
jgi:hypothetical protein